MKTVVFSDVHLQTTPTGREEASEFIAFLDRLEAASVDRLIILGDLFDFWFEYRHVIFSGYFEVLASFGRLRERGVSVHLVCGNHDFWAGRFLEDHLGFVIHRAPVVMDFAGRRVLLIHGDGVNARDWGYRIYRRIARARPVIGLFGLLHPDWAMAIARTVSRESRRISKMEDPTKGSEAAALCAYARDMLGRGEADVVMCGHAHAPALEQYATPSGTGLYINTGDWMYHRSYVEWDGTDFRLCRSADLPPEFPRHGSCSCSSSSS